MPTPRFILDLRAKVGHELLWLSTAMGAVFDDEGRVLLARRADNLRWGLPGGIIDPAEQPADAAVREVFEETGVMVIPEVMTSVTVSPPITYPNGDKVQYLEVCFRCRPVGGEAQVNDSESAEVAWHSLDALPDLDNKMTHLLMTALHADAAAFSFSGLDQVLGTY